MCAYFNRLNYSQAINEDYSSQSFLDQYKSTPGTAFSNTNEQGIRYSPHKSYRRKVKYRKDYNKSPNIKNRSKLTSINWARMGEEIDRQFGALTGVFSALGSAQVTFN